MATQITVDEKLEAQAPTTPTDENPRSLEGNVKQPNRSPATVIWTFLCGIALPCIPILVVFALLLAVISTKRVIPYGGWSQLRASSGDEHGRWDALVDTFSDIRDGGFDPAYFVDYQPTRITLISGWSSRIIPYLSGSIMALVAVVASGHLSRSGQIPSPKQLILLISLLGGNSVGPLRDTVVYRLTSEEKFVAPIPFVFAALAFLTLISLLITIVDSWFSISVHSVIITQLYNISSDDYHHFGRGLASINDSSTNCAWGPMYPAEYGANAQHFKWPCNTAFATTDPEIDSLYLAHGHVAAAVQLGTVANTAILNYTGPLNSSDSTESTRNHTIYWIGDKGADATQDFRSRTMGMSTQCEIITSKCVDIAVGDDSFQCNEAFRGNFSGSRLTYQSSDGAPVDMGYQQCIAGIGFAADPQLTRPAGMVSLTTGDGVEKPDAIGELLSQNPTYFGVWVHGYPALDRSNPLSQNQPEVVPHNSSEAKWVMNCSATFYDIEYSWVNGTLSTVEAVKADPAWAAFFSAPYVWCDSANMRVARLSLVLAAWTAAYTATTISELETMFAAQFSEKALMTSLGMFVPQVNQLEQSRDNNLAVTRVPMVPLYLLLGLKLLYVAAVLVLGVKAYCFTHYRDADALGAELSVEGILAGHFNQPECIKEKIVRQIETRFRVDESKSVGNQFSATDDTVAREVLGTAGMEVQGAREEPVCTANRAQKAVVFLIRLWKSIRPIVKEAEPIVKDIVREQAKRGKFGKGGKIYSEHGH